MSYDRDNSYGRQQEYGGGQQEYGRQQEYGSGGQQSYGQQNQGQEFNDTRYQGSQEQHADFGSAAHDAEQHSGQERGLFDTALSFLQQKKSSIANSDIDHEQAVQAHQAAYGQSSGQETHTSDSLGTGAAMQALKMFTSGGSSDGGFDQNKLISMAMSQASSLWDQKSAAGANMSGDKQSAVNSAAEMALKMYMKSGNNGGMSGGLMSLASKFM